MQMLPTINTREWNAKRRTAIPSQIKEPGHRVQNARTARLSPKEKDERTNSFLRLESRTQCHHSSPKHQHSTLQQDNVDFRCNCTDVTVQLCCNQKPTSGCFRWLTQRWLTSTTAIFQLRNSKSFQRTDDVHSSRSSAETATKFSLI